MARKVFISFLGTNNYIETHYDINGDISKPVRFIQEALIEKICSDWTSSDKIYIFYTAKSKQANWLNNGHSRFNENEALERIGLQQRLSDMNLKPQFVGIEIDEGFTESEIWNIFNVVYKQLLREDNIYFDVTHALRSIPMFSTILFNYAHFMLDVSIEAIHYGAFEKLGSVIDVKNMPLADRIAPIIDLTNMIRLQKYTEMANSVTSFGKIKHISQVLSDEHHELNPIIKQLRGAIERLDDALSVNRTTDIKDGKIIIAIRNNIKALRKIQNLPTPIKNVIERLNEELSNFVSENSNKNIEAAIEWDLKYKMIPQAYTLGREYIITLIVNILKDKNPYDSQKRDYEKKYREYISAICGISDDDINEKKFNHDLGKYESLTKELLGHNLICRIRPFYAQLAEYRNAINHAKGNATYDEFVSIFKKEFYQCLDIIRSYAD